MNKFSKSIFFLIIVLFLNFFSVYAQNFKCGDKIRITHLATGANLHSHNINYNHPNSSGQQQITAYQGADINDNWVLEDCTSNQIKNGTEFRLRHIMTGKYLHSHNNFSAPITQGQQEVTGWQGKDNNDIWRVEVEGRGNWSIGKKVRLLHVQTNIALHSHLIILSNRQQEVTGYTGRDNNDFWTADYANDSNNTSNDLTFTGIVQRSDVWSKIALSNGGKVDYTISIKNQDRYIGSCVVSYVVFTDSSGNIIRTFGGDQLCVDGNLPSQTRASREDKFKYSLNRDEWTRIGKVVVIFTSGGKISLDLFRGNSNRLSEMLQSCPECVRKDVIVDNRRLF